MSQGFFGVDNRNQPQFRSAFAFKGSFSGKHANEGPVRLQRKTKLFFFVQYFFSFHKNLYLTFFDHGELEKQGFRSNRDREDDEKQQGTLGGTSTLELF